MEYRNNDGTLKDKRVVADIRRAADMYENGELVEARDVLFAIVSAIDAFDGGMCSFLSDEEIDAFNSYIELDDMKVAFGNTDWCSIYSKIVRNRESEVVNAWKDKAQRE